jgi:hypothetical protein
MRHWRKAGLVLAVLFGLSMLAVAQDYRDYSYGYQGDAASQNAYNYGYTQGQQDRASGRRFDAKNGSFRIDKHYRDVYFNGYQAGYYGQNGGYGNGGVYGRRGDGDNDRDDRWRDRDWRNNRGTWGYNGGPYGGYPSGSYGNGNVAYQYGYKDGYDLGANDARRGAPYNDHGSGAYKHANNGFPGGNKDAYQQEYRQAYVQGYRAGYSQSRGGYGYRRPY